MSLAWLSQHKSISTKAVGLAAAIGGALLGGWLGFHATEGLAALLTTIVGDRRSQPAPGCAGRRRGPAYQ